MSGYILYNGGIMVEFVVVSTFVFMAMVSWCVVMKVADKNPK